MQCNYKNKCCTMGFLEYRIFHPAETRSYASFSRGIKGRVLSSANFHRRFRDQRIGPRLRYEETIGGTAKKARKKERLKRLRERDSDHCSRRIFITAESGGEAFNESQPSGLNLAGEGYTQVSDTTQ